MVRNFAETTLIDLKTQADQTQISLSEQIRDIQKFFEPQEEEGEMGLDPRENIVTYGQFLDLEKKVDQVILLQKELTAQLMEMTRLQQVAAVQRQKQAAKKQSASPKPPVNPLKFP